MPKSFPPKSYFIYKTIFDNSIRSGQIAPRGKAHQGVAQATLTEIFNRIPQTRTQFERLEKAINKKLMPLKLLEGSTFYDGEAPDTSDQIVDCLIELKDCDTLTEILTNAVKSSEVGMEYKPVGYALYLLEHDRDGTAKSQISQAAADLSQQHRTDVESLLVLVEQLTAVNVDVDATIADPVDADPVDADPVKVSDEYRQSRIALLNYVKCVIEKDAIAVDAIAEHYHMRQPHDASTLDEIAEKLFPSSEKDEKARQAPKAFEEILKLAKSCKERMKEFQIETIRSIRNVAICLSFPHELCTQACKDKLEYRPIRIPTGDIEWVKLFIGRVLGTIARSDSGPSNTDRSILERLTSDRESMIEIPIESLLPKSSEMVHPPRDSGASSVHFLTDLCMGIAKHLLVERHCNKQELEKFFGRWNGESSEIQCDSIETLQKQFEIWKILDGHLLLMVPGSNLNPYTGKFASYSIPFRSCSCLLVSIKM
ncbi:MAG: hypothetical protein ACOVLE_10855 [Pirellula staleyi]